MERQDGPFCFPITDALRHQHLRNINLVLFLSATPANVRTDVSKSCININKPTIKGSLSGPHTPNSSLECDLRAVVVETLEMKGPGHVCDSPSGGREGSPRPPLGGGHATQPASREERQGRFGVLV